MDWGADWGISLPGRSCRQRASGPEVMLDLHQRRLLDWNHIAFPIILACFLGAPGATQCPKSGEYLLHALMMGDACRGLVGPHAHEPAHTS